MEKPHSEKSPEFNAGSFGDNFAWGVASSAYQVEGAHNKHGKGPSIWDTFTKRKNSIFQGHNAQIACDFYHRYKEDIGLMARMNIRNFRFSLSWPRILPNGRGPASAAGLDFYDRLIDTCLENAVEPWVTLYHWDLPQRLQDDGGWTNRDMVGWFTDYTSQCAARFGDRVKYWMVLNEPMVFTGAGYFLGIHAPGEKGLRNFLPAVHHAVLCQAAGGRVLRDVCREAEIGTTFSCSFICPKGHGKKDVMAADRVDTLLNRLFLEPALGLGYPISDLKVIERIAPYIMADDMNKATFDFDFIGLQNYTREVVAHSYFVPYLRAKIIRAPARKVKITQMDWEVYPQAIYEMIRKFSTYKGVKKIIISENGAAFEDFCVQGRIHDPDRMDFLQQYLAAVYRAQIEGAPVKGYFVWTFTDNFEWAEGYYPRFGLVYVDFPTQERIIKSSGHWYARFIGG